MIEALLIRFLKVKVGKFMFKKLRTKLAKSKFIKGKLTYAGVAGVVAPLVVQLLGLEVGPEIVLDTVTWIGVGVTLFGRWRASAANEFSIIDLEG